MVESAVKEWIPLEGNPEIFSNYAEAIGFPSSMYMFHDVYGFEEEMWKVFIPQPVIAAIFLYEIKK
eukprot:CAMPEP_0176343704 /NCGR_PEP_ID=MMETSP0126-20121128/4135_1 /TAXON_ID=141414 ORGANISM="Strombidinopsis acuminatum, Strain SPMC142" /NCGR_SAMPLE_ID=MMETSP0126 /ASSEMBLY_ACC=CAM_ASM_000229 /LENGTH=65 /DNA_ID=CAMNT_0017689769 /DNA_START=39 /DNA_END=236 /DNA_ORIENTATION=+